MTILITGGTGFLGTYLANYLVDEKGCENEVVVFDRSDEFRWPWRTQDRVISVIGDVLRTDDVASVVEKYDVDQIVHLAAAVGAPDPERVIPFVELECMATANVFEVARTHDVQRVVVGSSIAAYGPQDVDELVETIPPTPDHLYGACKLWAEHLASHYTTELGVDSIVLRLGSIFGLGRSTRGSYGSGLIGVPRDFRSSVEQAVAGGPLLKPFLDPVVDFCYAYDAALAVWCALTVDSPPHRLFNVAAERRRVSEFVSYAQTLIPEARVEETEKAGALHRVMNTDRIRAELGFTPQYTMESGLDDYVARARAALTER